MYTDSRPLEALAAFAICFVTGMLSAAALCAHTAWVKEKASAGSAEHAGGSSNKE